MKWFRETTAWDSDLQPNHIYLMSDDKRKAYAYIRMPNVTPQVFKKPLQIDPRYRTFVNEGNL